MIPPQRMGKEADKGQGGEQEEGKNSENPGHKDGDARMDPQVVECKAFCCNRTLEYPHK